MIILLVTLATIASTTLGGLFAIRSRDKLHLILGFSAGAVLGVALFDLIPEAFELAGDSYGVRMIMILAATGFSLFMLLDRYFSLHGHDEYGDCKNPCHKGNLGASALVFHSFLDGIGIGLAFKVSPAIGWIVALAVLTHDFSDGINTVNMVLKNKGASKSVKKWLMADAVAPAGGVIVTLFISVSGQVLGLILAVFAGLFLYISASDLIPESHHRHPVIWTSLSTIMGLLLIFVVTSFA